MSEINFILFEVYKSILCTSLIISYILYVSVTIVWHVLLFPKVNAALTFFLFLFSVMAPEFLFYVLEPEFSFFLGRLVFVVSVVVVELVVVFLILWSRLESMVCLVVVVLVLVLICMFLWCRLVSVVCVVLELIVHWAALSVLVTGQGVI